MNITKILQDEIKGSFDFFYRHTNLDPTSKGYGLTVDSIKKPHVSSIASVGFALTAWVIGTERRYISPQIGKEITTRTLDTLLNHASHFRGFFAHFLDMQSAEKYRKCEFSTIDTALCLNGVITAAAYFDDTEITQKAHQLLERIDWNFIVFEENGKTLFRMAYNPETRGDYVRGEPGFIYKWHMAAEQKMMYLQAASHVDPSVARALYQGFSRDKGIYNGHEIIINPGGNLFAYQFTEAWFDSARYLDPDGVDWFENTRLAALANRSFCIEHSGKFKTYHENSWGASAGDSPWGYDVSGSTPSLHKPKPNGTVSIYSAVSSLPFIPSETIELICYLVEKHPQTWGPYGFYDSYNLDVSPPWFSNNLIGIDKGCSMIMIENYLTRLIWETYTGSPVIQNALTILGFCKR
jgi:hypothetical protein